MLATFLLRAARQAHVGEAAEAGSAAVILRVVREYGPCTKHVIWQHAEAAGVKSMRHTKLMLQWLRKTDQVQVKAQPKSREESELAKQAQHAKHKKKKGAYTPPPVDKEFVYSVTPKAS